MSFDGFLSKWRSCQRRVLLLTSRWSHSIKFRRHPNTCKRAIWRKSELSLVDNVDPSYKCSWFAHMTNFAVNAIVSEAAVATSYVSNTDHWSWTDHESQRRGHHKPLTESCQSPCWLATFARAVTGSSSFLALPGDRARHVPRMTRLGTYYAVLVCRARKNVYHGMEPRATSCHISQLVRRYCHTRSVLLSLHCKDGDWVE